MWKEVRSSLFDETPQVSSRTTVPPPEPSPDMPMQRYGQDDGLNLKFLNSSSEAGLGQAESGAITSRTPRDVVLSDSSVLPQVIPSHLLPLHLKARCCHRRS